MNTPQHASGHADRSFNPRKVAIPRLQRLGQPQGNSKDRRRVSRACTACRSHKIKCSGDNPRCKHCETTGRDCIYIMPRKDRLKIITDRCVQMASLLQGLKSRASEDENVRIAEVLYAFEEDNSEIAPMTAASIPEMDGDDPRDSAMMDVSPSRSHYQVDTDSLDLVDENLHENDRSRATGFVGKNSEVQWLRSLLQQERSEENSTKSRNDRRPSSAITNNSEQVSMVTFYLDNENVDLDFYVDPYELPTPETAERLLAVYMDKVHVSFPILPKRLFEDQFRKYFQALRQGTAPRLSRKWQAILNLIFAIGARYSHLIKASWRADERDHLIYQARARTFAWDETALTQHPDLPQIQVAGMLAFYYLSVGQVSRAWVVVGMALRYAYALGLHVRNEDPTASTPKREVLVRIWWSLYHLDRQLSVITGRPSVIVDSCCSVPLPIPLPEDRISSEAESSHEIGRAGSSSMSVSSIASPISTGPHPLNGIDDRRTPTGFSGRMEANTGSYFKAVVQMGIITQSILSSLYTAGTMIRSPDEISQDILQLGQRLDHWAALLPSEFSIQSQRAGAGPPTRPFLRERILLGFQACSARILLTRPCLGGYGQLEKDRKDTSVSLGFRERMANICVDAAKTELDLLPDQPNALFIYEYGPWWSIVHHLMQALATLLLALSYSSSALQDYKILAGYAKKIVRWLRSMHDPLAERAYRVALNSFEVVAVRLSLDISDLWREHALAFPNSQPGVMDVPGIDPNLLPSGNFGFDGAPNTYQAAYLPVDPSVAGSAFSSQPSSSGYEDFTSYHRPS